MSVQEFTRSQKLAAIAAHIMPLEAMAILDGHGFDEFWACCRQLRAKRQQLNSDMLTRLERILHSERETRVNSLLCNLSGPVLERV